MIATITVFIISLIIGLWLGSINGFLGLAAFCIIFFPSLIFALPIDIASGAWNEHRRREDEKLESLRRIERMMRDREYERNYRDRDEWD